MWDIQALVFRSHRLLVLSIRTIDTPPSMLHSQHSRPLERRSSQTFEHLSTPPSITGGKRIKRPPHAFSSSVMGFRRANLLGFRRTKSNKSKVLSWICLYRRFTESWVHFLPGGIDDVWAQRKRTEPKPLLTFIVVGKRWGNLSKWFIWPFNTHQLPLSVGTTLFSSLGTEKGKEISLIKKLFAIRIMHPINFWPTSLDLQIELAIVSREASSTAMRLRTQRMKISIFKAIRQFKEVGDFDTSLENISFTLPIQLADPVTI